MGLHHLAEAVLRLEYKLDALMRFAGVPVPPPMHFIGQVCPTCGQPVDYQIDVAHQIVVRRCGCKSGKVPSTFQLLPLPGVADGKATSGTVPPSSAGDVSEPKSAKNCSGSKVR